MAGRPPPLESPLSPPDAFVIPDLPLGASDDPAALGNPHSFLRGGGEEGPARRVSKEGPAETQSVSKHELQRCGRLMTLAPGVDYLESGPPENYPGSVAQRNIDGARLIDGEEVDEVVQVNLNSGGGSGGGASLLATLRAMDGPAAKHVTLAQTTPT